MFSGGGPRLPWAELDDHLLARVQYRVREIEFAIALRSVVVTRDGNVGLAGPQGVEGRRYVGSDLVARSCAPSVRRDLIPQVDAEAGRDGPPSTRRGSLRKRYAAVLAELVLSAASAGQASVREPAARRPCGSRRILRIGLMIGPRRLVATRRLCGALYRLERLPPFDLRSKEGR